jgi:lambda repressor-like predicted transcriptional regulator
MRTVFLLKVRRTAIAARNSEELAAGDREARDDAIEQAQAEGFSVREIATQAGMSASRIQAIVIDRTAARQQRLVQAAGLDGPPVGP